MGVARIGRPPDDEVFVFRREGREDLGRPIVRQVVEDVNQVAGLGHVANRPLDVDVLVPHEDGSDDPNGALAHGADVRFAFQTASQNSRTQP